MSIITSSALEPQTKTITSYSVMKSIKDLKSFRKLQISQQVIILNNYNQTHKQPILIRCINTIILIRSAYEEHPTAHRKNNLDSCTNPCPRPVQSI